MKTLRRISALTHAKVEPRLLWLVSGIDPDRESAQRVYPHAEPKILLGLIIAGVGFLIAPWIDGWHLHPLASQVVVYFGVGCTVLGCRHRLIRWIYRSGRESPAQRFTKPEIDGALQLSYVLTTAGGLSLVATHSRLFAVLIAGNIFAGIVVLDTVRELTRKQLSEDGVTYAVVNVGSYGCVRQLVTLQVTLGVLALTWLLVRQLR